MSETDTADMIGRRSELLARVVLTRRFDIEIRQFSDEAGAEFNLFCTLSPEPNGQGLGFYPFGVIVWGTAKELPTADKATKYGRTRGRTLSPKIQYLMPVVILLFSMQNDEAYFSWLVKPDHRSNKLFNQEELEFSPFDNRQLDKMVNAIKKWYQKLIATIVANPSEIAAFQLVGGE
jgi:hypothetical protein